MSTDHEHHWVKLGSGRLPTEDADQGLGHIVPTEVYFDIWVALLLLTVITVTVAFFDLGVLNLVVALGIATLKAALVTLFFMHLYYENKIFWGIVIYPLFIFVLIIGATLGDTRGKYEPLPENRPATPVTGISETGAHSQTESK